MDIASNNQNPDHETWNLRDARRGDANVDGERITVYTYTYCWQGSTTIVQLTTAYPSYGALVVGISESRTRASADTSRHRWPADVNERSSVNLRDINKGRNPNP